MPAFQITPHRFPPTRCNGLLRIIAISAICSGCDRNDPPAFATSGDTAALADDSAHGYLGITFDDIESSPLVIGGFVPGSHAESSGLQKGDVILRLDQIHNPAFGKLNQVVESRKPGSPVGIRIARDDEELEFRFALVSEEFVEQAMEPSR